MSKIIDTLTTLYRSMLLVAAVTIASSAYYDRNPYNNSVEYDRVSKTNTLYKEFLGDIAADATSLYRGDLQKRLMGQPDLIRSAVSKARFTPTTVSLSAPVGTITINLTRDIRLIDLFQLTQQNHNVYYSVVQLNSDQIARYIYSIIQDSNHSGVLDNEDLIITVDVLPGGLCNLRFSSAKWESQNHMPLSASTGCSPRPSGNVTSQWTVFVRNMAEIWNTPASMPPELMQLPIKIAGEKLATLASAETQQEKIDLFGVKCGVVAILNIGPIVIIFLLAMMLGQMRLLRVIPEKEPNDSAAWFGQFLGWPAGITVLTLVVLPFVAVGQGLTATYQENPEVLGLPWWAPALLWDQKLVIGGVVLVTVLSLWLYLSNISAARAWRAGIGSAV